MHFYGWVVEVYNNTRFFITFIVENSFCKI
jgi:hypothetical protein